MMKQESYELFKNDKLEVIVDRLDKELKTRNESPIWTERISPFASAILSVLIPLRDENMLFTPEGKKADTLTPELFLKWGDMVSLKTLAFTIQKSNDAGELLRTSLDSEVCKKYKEINLTLLGDYLGSCNINLDDEFLDFPISTYNLHQGVTNVIKSLL